MQIDGALEKPPCSSDIAVGSEQEVHRLAQPIDRIRSDIEQFPSADNAVGAAVYIQPGESGASGLAKAHAFIADNLGWALDGPDAKELYLTHRLIAAKAR